MKILFDLDGTLADNSHRVHLVAKSKDWDAYYAACGDDTPLDGAIALFKVLAINHHITILTGRREDTRVETVAWLKEHGIEVRDYSMVMRGKGDRRPNVEFKRGWIEGIISHGWNPEEILLIDDHPDAMDLSDVCRVVPIRSTW